MTQQWELVFCSPMQWPIIVLPLALWALWMNRHLLNKPGTLLRYHSCLHVIILSGNSKKSIRTLCDSAQLTGFLYLRAVCGGNCGSLTLIHVFLIVIDLNPLKKQHVDNSYAHADTHTYTRRHTHIHIHTEACVLAPTEGHTHSAHR